MWNRGRGAPSKSTSANVQCQKCLQKGHYSYECKAAPQERPYQARPSRTQQLMNPKLAPKLTSETTDTLQRKKGVADEQLAKKEAERAREQRHLTDDEDGAAKAESSPRGREASISSDSVSSISTTSPRSVRPSQGGRRRSPSVDSRASPKHSRSSRSRAFGSRSHSRSRPLREARPRSASRDSSRDSRDRTSAPHSQGRYDDRCDFSRGERGRRRRRGSPKYSDEERSPKYQRRENPSPAKSPAGRGRYDADCRRYRDRDDGPRGRDHHDRDWDQHVRAPPRRQEPRERSLSPFSKRIAMTRSMNAR